ncbi:MAG: sirohydrochlorin cobaltochelatase [Coriobacteriales bacterium]|nr:sirohydrochlorin cobaltochelatase [Coriobacteriales bacterium]
MTQQRLSRRSFVSAAAVGAAIAGAGLVGCASAGTTDQAAGNATTTAAPKPVILVTSFGTSYGSTRHVTIGAIEADIREAYATYDVRRAFTAQIVIDHIQKDTGRHIDNFEEAMDKLVAEGVREVVVQPTHLLDGSEFQDIKKSLANYADKFDKCSLGAPLLVSKEDQLAVVHALHDVMAKYEADDTAICLMGHGTEADANKIYKQLQDLFVEEGMQRYFVATVESTPTFADIALAAAAANCTKAVLRPLMVVAGDHAANDMADLSNPESFASVMERSGFEVTCVLEGLGQIEAIDELYVKHVQDAIDGKQA